MILSSISLQNFRSYAKKELPLDKLNLIVGENGAGKSNVIEAVYMAATGKSFRAERDNEMIKYGCQLSVVSCQLSNGDEIKVILSDRKKFEVNGVSRRMVDVVGKLKAVLFGPADMEIITGSPGYRRRYLDFVIAQMDREYRRCMVSYEKGLRQRNKLLELIREGAAQRHQLYFWDKLLIKDGGYITNKRMEYLEQFSANSLYAGKAGFQYSAYYDKSVISEERLKQYEVQEVAAAVTLVGPHRDDFLINWEGRDVSKYGSRGEQRMAVLALKKLEIKTLSHADTGESPVLLLDDVFSELDHRHREEVMKLVKEHSAQVIMTTADFEQVPNMKDANIIRI